MKRVALLCHGLASEPTSRGRFTRLAAALGAAGVDSHAVAFRSDRITDAGLDADLQAALAAARARFDRVALVGHSYGGLVALRAAAAADALVLTGAPLGAMDYSDDELLVVPAHVDPALLDAVRTLDARPLLARVRYPALLICGDGDREERMALETARAALPLLPAGSRLELIAGAPHGFADQFDRVIALAVDWLSRPW